MQRIEYRGFGNRFARLQSIQVHRRVAAASLWHLDAQEFADDYRMRERMDMLVKGAPTGTQLRDVRLGRWSVGDLNLYHMRYTHETSQAGKTLVGDGLLLLHFPHDYKASHAFYIFHFADMCDIAMCKATPSVDLDLAYAVIKSARLR